MKYFGLSIVFLSLLFGSLSSCSEKKQDHFEAYSQQSCQDFQALVASYSTNMLVPLRPDFLPENQQAAFCTCLDKLLRKKVKPKYNAAQLEGMQNFQQERLALLQKVLKSSGKDLMNCLEKQDITEIRIIRKFLESLKETKEETSKR